mmetsp:Transcript_18059/g.37876  ORF Transcript_18059/g.37876 Transcript_18059/m.37876 type:complete len:449 (-) Transcript_18059:81-1427(-)
MITRRKRIIYRNVLPVALIYSLIALTTSISNHFSRIVANAPFDSELRSMDPSIVSFPTREERVKYYMGDWYNRTLHPHEIDCRGIRAANVLLSNVPVLMTAEWITSRENRTESADWRDRCYVRAAYDVIRASGHATTTTYYDNGRIAVNEKNDITTIPPMRRFDRFILLIGDQQYPDPHLPVAVKTRYSRHAFDKSTNLPFFRNMIWPLNMKRHYDDLGRYKFLQYTGRVTKWEHKKETLIWRGAITGYGPNRANVAVRVESDENGNVTSPSFPYGPRIHAVATYFHADTSVVDVAFPSNAELPRQPEIAKLVTPYLRNTHRSMREQLQFKYILSLEGNDVATGLKWQMLSNSVVFMTKPTIVSFFMEDLLVPFVHYIPVKEDLSDLVDMVMWARENDERVRWISEQATRFVKNVWDGREARRDFEFVKRELGRAYFEQFYEAVRTCG